MGSMEHWHSLQTMSPLSLFNSFQSHDRHHFFGAVYLARIDLSLAISFCFSPTFLASQDKGTIRHPSCAYPGTQQITHPTTKADTHSMRQPNNKFHYLLMACHAMQSHSSPSHPISRQTKNQPLGFIPAMLHQLIPFLVVPKTYSSLHIVKQHVYKHIMLHLQSDCNTRLPTNSGENILSSLHQFPIA